MLAVVGTGLIVIFWVLLPGRWGEHIPFSLFLFVVAGAAWVGGFWAGMVAVALGALSACYFGVPRFIWVLESQADWLLFGAFVAAGHLMAAVCAQLRRAAQDLRRANMEIERQAREEASALERLVAQRTGELQALLAERNRLLESERSARSEAERATRLRDEFVATVSHELRTPLNAMLGWAGLIRSGKLDVRGSAKAIEVIERNARLQAALVEDLLDVSRIGSGKLRMEVRNVDFAAVVEGALASHEPAAKAKGIEIEKAIEGGACVVSGDPGRLEQIASNLLSNAVKFTPPGGRVLVTCHRRGSRAELTVRDTGQGIVSEFLPLVFDRFRQAEVGTTRRHGGLGLGLTLVKFLVEQHGGVVRAESEGEGRGATFTVTLPIAATDGRPTASTPIEAGASLAGVKALVVDDEADARLLVCRLLEDYGVQVTLASSGHEALNLLPTLTPDVIISDIGMPELDGYGLLRAVRELASKDGRATPAVALTAFSRPADRQRAMEAGYVEHLAKPVNASDLVMAVARATGRCN